MRNEQTKVRNAIARMIDGYSDGIIEKREFEPRVKQARAKLARIEAQMRAADKATVADQQLRLLIVQFENFSSQVLAKLQTLDFEAKRNVILALVKRLDMIVVIGPSEEYE